MSPTGASMMVSVFDGGRKPLPGGIRLLVRIIEGTQTCLVSGFYDSPNVYFSGLPFRNSLADFCSVIVSAKGYVQAGFTSVRISPDVLQRVELMLLPRRAEYNFRQARWSKLSHTHPRLIQLLSRGLPSEALAKKKYEQMMEQHPTSLAGFLNIATALGQAVLPAGAALDYIHELDWETPPRRDRFFAWARNDLRQHLDQATAQGGFQPASSCLHPGATSSFKQTQFGEANLQITLHERARRTIEGSDCFRVEFDIDYYRDLCAHTILEVLPNSLSGRLTDPKKVYALRWMACRRAGEPEFDPPYSIVKADLAGRMSRNTAHQPG